MQLACTRTQTDEEKKLQLKPEFIVQALLAEKQISRAVSEECWCTFQQNSSLYTWSILHSNVKMYICKCCQIFIFLFPEYSTSSVTKNIVFPEALLKDTL